MIARKSGKIVFVSSVAGKVPIPFRSSYAASKHALQAFADTLRAEIKMHGITVLVSSPEYITSDFQQTEIETPEIGAPEIETDKSGKNAIKLLKNQNEPCLNLIKIFPHRKN